MNWYERRYLTQEDLEIEPDEFRSRLRSWKWDYGFGSCRYWEAKALDPPPPKYTFGGVPIIENEDLKPWERSVLRPNKKGRRERDGNRRKS